MKNTIETQGFKYGLITVAFLIAFFFLMRSVGLLHNFNLRVLNSLFLLSTVFLGIRSYKARNFESFKYLEGVGIGFVISLTTGILFSAFVLMYISIDPSLMQAIKANEPQGVYMNEIRVTALVMIEAIASGLLFTYGAMQFLKKSRFASAS